MRYSTLVMASALVVDLVVVAIFLLVALALRQPGLEYGAYALAGAFIFVLIGMGAALGLEVGNYKRSTLVVSVVFNIVMAILIIYSRLDLAAEALGLLLIAVNVALTAIAYSNMDSGREVTLPLLGF